MNAIAGTYLEQIVVDVRSRVDELPEATSSRASNRARRSLVESILAVRERDMLAVIGEVKRRSPSVGSIREQVDPVSQATAYRDAGAAGISVLTERDHFGGSIEDLDVVSRVVDIPVLCKDFIVDERQLDLAVDAGASAALLIAAIHDDTTLDSLIRASHARGLEVLLEVHDEPELQRALATGADVIGINNRDLRSFAVDLAVSERLARIAVGAGRPIVAESGVRSRADAARMRAAGVDAILVGEALMRASDPGRAVREFSTVESSSEVIA